MAELALLKATRTLDPRSGRPVEARVVTDAASVYLQAAGSDELTAIERDVELYRMLMRAPRARRTPSVSHLVVEPTYRCNLECPLCFTHEQGADLTIDEIAAGIAGHRGRVVSISGGEPTVRDDLPAIVRLVARDNIALLATNGLRLADRAYVDELRRAGLRHVTFSFNGFSEGAQLATNGRVTLERKLQAIENLVAADLRFLLSMLVVRGSNEGEIGRVFELAVRHPRHIKEVRLRSAAPIGKHRDRIVPLFPSEMLALLCEQTGLAQDELRRDLRLYRRLGDLVPFLPVMQKSCSFSFYLRREGARLRSLSAFTWRDLAALAAPSQLGALLRRSIWHHDERLLKVSVRVWPTLSTLDLQDHLSGCNSRYVAGPKRGLPVCYANILHDHGWLDVGSSRR